MTNKVLHVDVETGIEEVRDQTTAERDQHLAESQAFAAEIAERVAEQAAAKAAKEAAAEKLAALGLTTDDLKALGL